MAEISLKNNHQSIGRQLDILREYNGYLIESFKNKLKTIRSFPLMSININNIQINLGKMCNQICKHCHVDAHPNRKEIMSRHTMDLILEVIKKEAIQIVDLTGGAPEMNPNFFYFINEISKFNVKILVRSNLTILETNKHKATPQFFAEHQIEIVSSLPYYKEHLTDIQRGTGVFRKSIKMLRRLNELGYGKKDSGLILNLVYNPVGAYLPPEQNSLEKEYRSELKRNFDIEFNRLFCITNIPISRYLEYLIDTDNYEEYMELLMDSFNPEVAKNVMCRKTLSIGWDGQLYDCDFNQMLELPIDTESSKHIKNWNTNELMERRIVLGNHCYACTAGAGSSCGGSLV